MIQKDIMINNYNYSQDIRNWEAKQGKTIYLFTKELMRCALLDNKGNEN